MIRLRSILSAPLDAIMRQIIFRSAFPMHRGIVIGHLGFVEDLDHAFVSNVRNALDLLATSDTRRYNRVRRFVKAVVKSRWRRAFYSPSLCTCHIGGSSVFAGEAELRAAAFACVAAADS